MSERSIKWGRSRSAVRARGVERVFHVRLRVLFLLSDVHGL